jgi:hypothetical protein
MFPGTRCGDMVDGARVRVEQGKLVGTERQRVGV